MKAAAGKRTPLVAGQRTTRRPAIVGVLAPVSGGGIVISGARLTWNARLTHGRVHDPERNWRESKPFLYVLKNVFATITLTDAAD